MFRPTQAVYALARCCFFLFLKDHFEFPVEILSFFSRRRVLHYFLLIFCVSDTGMVCLPPFFSCRWLKRSCRVVPPPVVVSGASSKVRRAEQFSTRDCATCSTVLAPRPAALLVLVACGTRLNPYVPLSTPSLFARKPVLIGCLAWLTRADERRTYVDPSSQTHP